jgi:hypothetical protein
MADPRKTLGVRFVAEGIEDVRRALSQLGTSGRQAADQITQAFGRIRVGEGLSNQLTGIRQQITQTFSNLKLAQGFVQQFAVIRQGLTGLREAFNSLKINPAVQAQLQALRLRLSEVVLAGQRFGQSLGTLGTAFGAFGQQIATMARNLLYLKGIIALVAGGLGLLAARSASNAERIQNQADALGVSTDQYQRLGLAATDAGLEIGALDRFLAKFAIGVEKAGDEAEKAGEKTGGVVKQFEEFTFAAKDGTKSVVSVTRGAKDLKAEFSGLAGVTKPGVEGVLQYAASIAKLKTNQEQLAAVAKDFGTKAAASTLVLLRNLTFQFDDAARAAAGLIKPLSQGEIDTLVLLDAQFDNIGTNLTTLKDRLVAVFGPTLTAVLKLGTGLIQAYEKDILSFAETVKVKVIGVLLDLLKIFRGNDAGVSNKWLLDIRDAAITTKDAFVLAFKIILFGFNQLRNGASGIAALINSIFGTKLTGDALLATVAFLKFSGALKLLATVLAVVAAAWQVTSGGIMLAYKALRLLGFSFPVVTAAGLASAAGMTAAFIAFGGAVVKVRSDIRETLGIDVSNSVLVASAQNPAIGGTILAAGYWELIRDAINEAFGNPPDTRNFFQTIIDGHKDAFEKIKAATVEARDFIFNQFTDPDSFTRVAFANWLSSWQKLFSEIGGLATKLAGTIRSVIGTAVEYVTGKVRDLIAAIKSAVSAASSSESAAPATTPSRYASGGFVSGPGTSRSDSIPARLSNGEFVLTARAVKKFGLNFLYALNGLRIPSGMRQGFADGGLVTAGLSPQFATQRLPESGGALHRFEFVMGGETIGGFRGSASALNQLGKAAQRARLASPGRVPHWKGKT